MKKNVLLVLILLSVFIVTGCSKLSERNNGKCKGCVYAKYSDNKRIGSSLNEYVEDYRKLNSNLFIGHVLQNGNRIKSAYLCGILDDDKFCILVTIDGSSSEANEEILEKTFGKSNCERSTEPSEVDPSVTNIVYKCHKDNIDVYNYRNGKIKMTDGKTTCEHDTNGIINCKE